MGANLGLGLLGLAGLALVAFSVYAGMIGVRGGTVHRADSPFLYWLVVLGTCLVSGAALLLAIVRT
jgi:hypothetical protein